MKILKILIIEDETVLALHIERFLKRKSYLGFIAASSDVALKIIEKHNIDMIISDINIKGEIDGIATCKIIQDIYDIPTIYLTAYKDEQTLQRAAQTNFLGYLLKPFREDELDVLLQLSIKKLGLLDKKSIETLTQNYSICTQTKTLFHKETAISLSKKEKQLFFLLWNHKNQLVPFEQIEEDLWCGEPVSNASRRQVIYRLRQKLSHMTIENVKSLGLKLIL